MSVLDWYHQIKTEAIEAPNCPQKVKLMFHKIQLGWDEEEPLKGILHFEETKAMAVQLNNPFIALWADIWILQNFIEAGELGRSYDLAVKAALESRDWKYSETPLGIMANNLLTQHLADLDPHGFKSEIESACNYLDEICPPESDHACIYYGTMYTCSMRLGDLDRAREYLDRRRIPAERDVAEEKSWFFMAWQYCSHAHLAHLVGEWDEVLCQADCGLSKTVNEGQDRIALVALRANALARKGETRDAATAFRRISRDSHVTPDDRCYDAMTDYWLALDENQKAIEVRLNQQEECDGKGRHWEQASSALHLVELYETGKENENARIWTDKLRTICENLKRPWHSKFASRLVN